MKSTTQTLEISKDLLLPIDTVTQTIAILAKRRAGKSYTMRRITEQLVKAGQQIVLVDPKGDQWGIRSSADGKSPGLPVVILGGERGDVPLEPGSGELVAKLVVEERVSVLLDLSLFRKHEVATFMTAFLENIYRMKAREVHRTPLMVVIDEADAIAPQKPQSGEERMLGAADDIVRRGGQRGIGCILVTQRSAVLNKNVLTQSQILVALRTIAPQDLKALDEWIQVHGEPEQRKILLESLPSLPVGDAWFWSPGWPTEDGIFKRVHVVPIETFDSGKTPEPGERRIEPKNLADVDLDALKRQMSATIERAKQNDPAQLKQEIAQLKRELAQRPQEKTEVKEVPIFSKAELKEIVELQDATRQAADYAGTVIQQSKIVAELLSKTLRKFASAPVARPIPQPAGIVPYSRQTASPAMAARTERSATNGSLPKAERAILRVLANFPEGKTRREVGVIAGYKHTGGGFNNALGGLRTRGLIVGSDLIKITEAGSAAYGPVEPLPSGRELFDYWRRHPDLGRAEREILRVLFESRETMTKEVIAPLTVSDRGTPYEPNGGGFNNGIGRLRTYELVNSGPEGLQIREEFLN